MIAVQDVERIFVTNGRYDGVKYLPQGKEAFDGEEEEDVDQSLVYIAFRVRISSGHVLGPPHS